MAVLYLVSNYVDVSVLCLNQAMMEQMTVKLGELEQQLAIKDQTITQLQSVLCHLIDVGLCVDD